MLLVRVSLLNARVSAYANMKLTSAELHQLTSPNTAYHFLGDVLNLTHKVDSSIGEVELFGKYIWRSWAGLIRSSGVLP